jgi:protein required for attachment to host cells
VQNEWWIVVVDGSRARFFEAGRLPSALNEVEDLIDPAGRMSERELGTDRPGRSFESVGGARHALSSASTARQRGRQQFARRVADRVDDALAQGRFRRLGLVAPPAMLGELRHALSARCRSRCDLELASDIGQFGRTQIERHIAHAVPVARG